MNTTTNTNTQVKLVMTGKIQNGTVTIQTDPTFAPAVTPVSPAFASGIEDAQKGDAFFPESWGWGFKRIQYTQGFLAIRPDNEAANAYRAGFVSQGYDMYWADKPYAKCWNDFMRDGWKEAESEWIGMMAEKDAKSQSQDADDWAALAEDEIIGSW